jgi:ribonuclease HI
MHFPREKATNNIAEYEGLLAGLRISTELGIKKLIIHGDSQLVVRQVNKDYQSPLMEAYVEEVRKLEEQLTDCQQSTCHVRKTALLIICQNALHRSFLWNQGLLFST